jgi:glyoxylase-like metal-dependent hydrolase (beta-lactamase superfamily II)
VPVEVTGAAQRAAWAERVLPPVERVGEGIWSIPVPIPQNPLRYVLVYAFEHDQGIHIVDAGWNTDEAWQALSDGIALAGYSITDIKGVLVTHIHPDHYGLAGRVRQASGAWVGLHPDDAALIPGRYGVDMNDVVAQMRDLLVRHGVPAGEIDGLTTASFGIREWVDAVEPDRLIHDGDRVDIPQWDVRAVHTPGHSPGHLCFHVPERKLLLSGDHVLPRITPNITVHAQQEPNPLADFLDSLAQIEHLDVNEVLPAHEWRFAPLRTRVAEIIEHHRVRLQQVLDVLAERAPATCWEVATGLEWSRPWDEVVGFLRRAAVGETLAHLTLLESQGRVRRQDHGPVHWVPVTP